MPTSYTTSGARNTDLESLIREAIYSNCMLVARIKDCVWRLRLLEKCPSELGKIRECPRHFRRRKGWLPLSI